MAQRRLLLADDSVTIQKVVNLTFADEGIVVVAVGDGDAAMQKFVEATPDLVMVDVNMPGLDGYRICEMIKQDDETKHIPVILLVGSFEPFDEEEARRVGADDFLTKPFQSIRQLVNKVSDLLNGRKSDTFGDEPEAVNSFDETLEMNSPFEKESAIANFGDAAMDDEMIQTSQIGSLPIDETPKYESDSSYQPPEEESASNLRTDDEESGEPEKEETPVLTEDFEDYESETAFTGEDDSTDEREILPRHENIYDFANEQELAEDEIKEESAPEIVREESADEIELPTERELAVEIESSPFEEESAVEIAPPVNEEEFKPDEVQTVKPLKTAAISRFDEFDLLELPQSKKFRDSPTETPVNQFASAAETLPAGNLSPQEIEAIADRVVEKLSDQVVKRIVREVFNQMSKKK